MLAILTGMREEEIAKELNGSRREEVQEKKTLKYSQIKRFWRKQKKGKDTERQMPSETDENLIDP